MSDAAADSARQRVLPLSGVGKIAADVHALDELSGEGELPFLLLRLNDWVPAVAKRAARGVEARVEPGNELVFAENLPFLERVRHQSRVNHQPLLSIIDTLLTSAAGRKALFQVLRDAPNKENRRSASRLLAASNAPSSEIIAGFSDSDPVVRSILARAACRTAS
jgi:hypothetical protein